MNNILPVGVVKRKRMNCIPFGDSDPDRVVVSMIEFHDRIYVATQKGVYYITDDKMVRLKFKEKKEE